jgi:hypothetical protein
MKQQAPAHSRRAVRELMNLKKTYFAHGRVEPGFQLPENSWVID